MDPVVLFILLISGVLSVLPILAVLSLGPLPGDDDKEV